MEVNITCTKCSFQTKCAKTFLRHIDENHEILNSKLLNNHQKCMVSVSTDKSLFVDDINMLTIGYELSDNGGCDQKRIS